MSADSPVAEPQMNATPLIDAMLVLLVVLIITLPVSTHATNLNLPQGPPVPPPASVRIDIFYDGSIYWNDEPHRLCRGVEAQVGKRGAPGKSAPDQCRSGKAHALRPGGASPGRGTTITCGEHEHRAGGGPRDALIDPLAMALL